MCVCELKTEIVKICIRLCRHLELLLRAVCARNNNHHFDFLKSNTIEMINIVMITLHYFELDDE